MHKKCFLTIVVLLFYSILFVAQEQTKSFFFNKTSVEDGLSQSKITSICRDYQGLLWVGTMRGLNQLNRGELRVYYHDSNNPQSIPSNHIYQIREDQEQTLWIATEGGLCKYNTYNDSFDLINKDKIFSITSISSYVFFGGNGYVTVYKDGKAEKLHLEEENKNNSHNNNYNVVAMVSMPNKKNDEELIIATRNKGLYTLSLCDKKIRKMEVDTKGQALLAMHISKEEIIYLSIYNRGLLCYSKDGILLERFSTLNSKINSNIILDIIEKNNDIWLATDGGGINIIDKETREVSIIQKKPGVYGSIPANSLTQIYRDQGNNYWIGSVREGLISMKEVYMRSYKEVPFGAKSGLSEKTIISLFEDWDKTVWIGTDGGGLNSFDPKSKTFTHYKDTEKGKISSVTNLNKNELLLSLYPEGLVLLNKYTKKIKPINPLSNLAKASKENNGYQPHAHQVSKDKIYIISQEMSIYSPSKDKLTPMKYDPSIDPCGAYLAYTDDKESFMFRDNQLFRVNQQNDSIELFIEIQENINCAAYDGDSLFWIGTNSTVLKLNTLTHELTPS